MKFSYKFEKFFFRAFPGAFWKAYKHHAQNIGMDNLYLILSFDCDRDQDVPASLKITEWLVKREIKSTFAVPGEQLLKGKNAYKSIAQSGSQFINHGSKPHVIIENGKYVSTTFYHRMKNSEVEQDIRSGHDICTDVTGTPPQGFRAPHFGLYQEKHQLNFLYEILESMQYKFSTSTIPRFSYKAGPAIPKGKLLEFPLSGSYRDPFQLLDSYGHLNHNGHESLSNKYIQKLNETADRLIENNIPGILNYYVDPSHVVECHSFYNTLEYFLDRGITSAHYTDIIPLVK